MEDNRAMIAAVAVAWMLSSMACVAYAVWSWTGGNGWAVALCLIGWIVGMFSLASAADL